MGNIVINLIHGFSVYNGILQKYLDKTRDNLAIAEIGLVNRDQSSQ